MAADLLALTLLESPGALGADVVVGSTQRFGVPLFYGGPHAGYMAVAAGLERHLPGRLVGVSRRRRGLDLLIEEARRLSRDFMHVRVDFLRCDDDYAFSELTFASMAARVPFDPPIVNEQLGHMMKLEHAPAYLELGRSTGRSSRRRRRRRRRARCKRPCPWRPCPTRRSRRACARALRAVPGRATFRRRGVRGAFSSDKPWCER